MILIMKIPPCVVCGSVLNLATHNPAQKFLDILPALVLTDAADAERTGIPTA